MSRKRRSPLAAAGTAGRWLLGGLLMAALPSVAAAAQLGRDPAGDVQVVAEQSEALCLWYKAGARGLPLVHVSARLNIDSARIDLSPGVESVRAALERETCGDLRPRTASAVRKDALYDPDNFLVPAHLIGVVSEVWWVIPTREEAPGGGLEPFRERLRETFGLPADFIDSLRQEGTAIRGAFRGLPVRIVTLTTLPSLPGPALVAIDAEYLLLLYENPVKEPVLGLLGGFLPTLRDWQGDARGVVISSSHRIGRVPLSFGYVAHWLRELLAVPARLSMPPSETWKLQGRLEYLDLMGSRSDAIEAARRLAELDPLAPAPWYNQAVFAAEAGSTAEALRLLEEAVRRDPEYRTGYLALAAVLLGQEKPEEARSLVAAGCRRFPEDAILGLGLIELMLKLGRPADAAAEAADFERRLPGYPAAAADRAFALRAAGDMPAAVAAMETFRRTAPEGGMKRATLAAWEAAAGEVVPQAEAQGEADGGPQGEADGGAESSPSR